MKFYVGYRNSNNFGAYEVVSIEGRSFTVLFERTGTKASFCHKTLCKNQCYDYMQPTTYGVGYLGEMITNDQCPVKNTATCVWQGIMRRCYLEDVWVDRPNYQGCEVSEDWKSLKNFREFFKNQVDLGFYKKGYQLDKDLLVLHNKTYSEDSCVFLPFVLNSLQQVDKRSNGGFLPGVHFDKARNKFKSEVSYDGKRHYLGRFNTEIEAFEKYKSTKEDLVSTGILKWEGQIEQRAYKAFENYSLSWIYDTDSYKNLQLIT